MAIDVDDALSEARFVGAATTTAKIVNDSISPDTDVDMVRFSVTSGQTVDFDIDTPANGPGGLGSFVRLFDAQGRQLATNNNGAAPGENTVGFDAYLRFTFATAGNYYIGVSNFNNTAYNPVIGNGDVAGGQHSTGSYSLAIKALPVDTDDTRSEAISLGAISATPKATNAAIDPDVDVDMYRFTASAGQTIDFDIDTTRNGPGGLGSFLRLFDSQGQEIAFNDNGLAPNEDTLGFDAYLRYSFGAGGTYYLGVSNANNTLYNTSTGGADVAGGQHSIGAYTLTVNTAPAAPADPDDTRAEAAFLGAVTGSPRTVSGAISPDTDVDMYRFTVTAGQAVDFDIDTTQNGPGGLGSFLRIFNSSGRELNFNDNGAAPGETAVGFDAYLRHRFSSGGTFYVGVSNANNTLYDSATGTGDQAGGPNATGAYQLTINLRPSQARQSQASSDAAAVATSASGDDDEESAHARQAASADSYFAELQ